MLKGIRISFHGVFQTIVGLSQGKGRVFLFWRRLTISHQRPVSHQRLLLELGPHPDSSLDLPEWSGFGRGWYVGSCCHSLWTIGSHRHWMYSLRRKVHSICWCFWWVSEPPSLTVFPSSAHWMHGKTRSDSCKLALDKISWKQDCLLWPWNATCQQTFVRIGGEETEILNIQAVLCVRQNRTGKTFTSLTPDVIRCPKQSSTVNGICRHAFPW